MNRLEKAMCKIKTVFLCPEEGDSMPDLIETMRDSQQAIAGQQE